MQKFLCVIALCVVTVGFLSGCNTVEGFGRDVENAGRSINKAAK